jgi:tetratricopeptide (TPR) repeat protein
MQPGARTRRMLRILAGAGLMAAEFLVAGCAAEPWPRAGREEAANGADFAPERQPGWGITIDPAGGLHFADAEAGVLWQVDARGRAAVLLEGVHAHELYGDSGGALYGDDLVWDGGWRSWRRGFWRLDPAGRLTDVLPPALEVPPGMGLLADRRGNRYAFGRRGAGGALVLFRRAPGGTVTSLAGGGPGQADGHGAAAGFERVRAVRWGPDGALYASDGAAVRRITLNGDVSTLGGNPVGGLREPWPLLLGLAIDPRGHVLVADQARAGLLEITPGGAVSVRLEGGPFWSPAGVVADRRGIYVLEARPARASARMLGWLGPRLRVRRLTANRAPVTLARVGGGPLAGLSDPTLIVALAVALVAAFGLTTLAALAWRGVPLALARAFGRPLFAAPVGRRTATAGWFSTHGFAVASWSVLLLVLWALLREVFGPDFQALHVEALVVLFFLAALFLQVGPSLVSRIRKFGPVEFFERTSGLLAALAEIELAVSSEGLNFAPVPENLPPSRLFAYSQADRYLTLLEHSGEEVGSGNQRDRYFRLLMAVGWTALQLHDFQRSQHWLGRLHKLSEGKYEPGELLLILGQAYLQCARQEEEGKRRELLVKAADCYREKVRANPDGLAAWFWLGYVADELENYGSAVKYNRYALRIKPQFANAKYNLAAATLKAGRPARSLRVLESIRQTDQGFEQVREAIKKDSDFDELRADARFVQLCQNWQS